MEVTKATRQAAPPRTLTLEVVRVPQPVDIDRALDHYLMMVLAEIGFPAIVSRSAA